MNQEGMYVEYEPEVDIHNMICFILYKWRLIFIISIIFGLAVSGIGFIRKMTSDPTKEPKKIMEYRWDLARYQLDIDHYQLNIEDCQERLDWHEKYMEESILMHMDPYNISAASADIFVKLNDEEWNSLPDNINVDPTDSLIKMYTSNFSNNLNWEPLESLTGSDRLYLKELLSVASDYNSNSFTINVVHFDIKMAEEILNIIVEQVMEKYYDISKTVNEHTLSVVNESLTRSVDTSLVDRLKNNRDAITDYKRTIFNLQQTLEELKEEEPKEPLVIGFIKYPVAGFILGIFLSFVIYGMVYLLDGKLYGEREIKNKFGYLLLGVYPRQLKKQKFARVDRLLENLLETGKYSKETVNQRIAANLKNLIRGNKNIMITGTTSLEKLQTVMSEVTPLLQDITLIASANMNITAETLLLLNKCDGVILVEERGYSLLDEIREEHESIMALNKPVIGYILL